MKIVLWAEVEEDKGLKVFRWNSGPNLIRPLKIFSELGGEAGE